MKAKDKTTGQFKKVYVKAMDALPVGTELDFDGSLADLPEGWVEVPNPEEYLPTEVKTNKTWIDGKPIYRKVIAGTAPGTSGWYSVNAGLSNVSEVINIYGSLSPETGRWLALPYSESGYAIALDCTPPNLEINFQYGMPGSFKIILEYTKTTD